MRDTLVFARMLESTVAWSPDGARVAFVVRDTIFTVSAGDTTRRRVAVHRAGYPEPHSLAWSPEGRYIAYVNDDSPWRIGEYRVVPSSIWIVSAAGGEPQRVTDQDHLNVSPAWLDERHLLFVSDRDGARALYVVEVGPHGARGAPRPVPGVADPHSISYSIDSKRLAYSKLTVRQNIWSYPLGRSVPLSIRDGRPVTAGNQVIEWHDVSPDGRWILYNSNRRGRGDLYKMPLAGGESVPLTETLEDEAHPRWSPDGKEIAYTLRGALQTVWVMPADGGRRIRITREAIQGTRPRWAPDGLRIVFLSAPSGGPDWRAWVVSRDSVGGRWHSPVMLADIRCWPLAWAPDGTGVLCGPDDRKISLLSANGQVLWKQEIPFTWIGDLRYSRDGRMVYFVATHLDGRRGIWAISHGGRGAVRLVVAFDDPALSGTMWLSVGPDRLYLSVAKHESDIWVATLRF
jgi:Tol biopolymer transport system component